MYKAVLLSLLQLKGQLRFYEDEDDVKMAYQIAQAKAISVFREKGWHEKYKRTLRWE